MSPSLTLYLRAIEPSLRIARGMELAREWPSLRRDEKAEYLTQCVTPNPHARRLPRGNRRASGRNGRPPECARPRWLERVPGAIDGLVAGVLESDSVDTRRASPLCGGAQGTAPQIKRPANLPAKVYSLVVPSFLLDSRESIPAVTPNSINPNVLGAGFVNISLRLA